MSRYTRSAAIALWIKNRKIETVHVATSDNFLSMGFIIAVIEVLDVVIECFPV